MKPILTIGLATFDDYDGVYFTLQNLRLQLKDELYKYEFIVIDNNPTSKQGIATEQLVKNWVKGKYIPFTDKQSTSIRSEIFKHASSDYVLCIDCHVLLTKDAIHALINYYEDNPYTKNLIHGPLLYDDMVNRSTHFNEAWRDNMWGTWGTDLKGLSSNEPFEIPMCGLGLFSSKTSEWKGFNPWFRGFGAEEGYIHEKFRMAGGKVICIPELEWVHRFNRPNGVPYHSPLEDRIWNYYIGWMELLRDPNHQMITSITEHFQGKIPDYSLDLLRETASRIYGK